MTFNIEELYNKLIDRLYPSNIEKNKKLKEGDPSTLRSLVRFADKGFGSDYILEIIDFKSLEKMQELIKEDKKEEALSLFSKYDFEPLNDLKIIATRKKIADIIYRLKIGNLHIDSEELEESLDQLDINPSKKEKELKLEKE